MPQHFDVELAFTDGARFKSVYCADNAEFAAQAVLDLYLKGRQAPLPVLEAIAAKSHRMKEAEYDYMATERVVVAIGEDYDAILHAVCASPAVIYEYVLESTERRRELGSEEFTIIAQYVVKLSEQILHERNAARPRIVQSVLEHSKARLDAKT